MTHPESRFREDALNRVSAIRTRGDSLSKKPSQHVGRVQGAARPACSAWWLERAYRQRDGGLSAIKAEMTLKSLRTHPRFEAPPVRKMKLPVRTEG